MYIRFLSFQLILAATFLISCQRKNMPPQNKTKQIDTLVHKALPDTIKIRREKRKNFPDASKFKAFLEKNISDSLNKKKVIVINLNKETIILDSLTFQVYKANNYKAFWNDSAKCHRILKALSNSRFDGMLPKDYGIPSLDSLFNACFIKKKRNDTLYWKLELEVTKNYLHYLYHLQFGKTNPEKIFEDWDYKREMPHPYTAYEFSKFLYQNPDTIISELRPQYSMYTLLRNILHKLDTIQDNKFFEWDPIPYIGKDLKQGDTSWVIIKIKNRLLSVGIGQQDSATTLFDEDLLNNLSYFQKHVGLEPNKKIDNKTISKLNFTLQEIEDVVRVNMERCRWLSKSEQPKHYIIVNIADYTLRIYKNEKQLYKTKVVVGSINKETPIFRSKLSTIEFNPYWTVPVSISKDEILPKLKTDPDYLKRNNMELLKGDSVVQVTDFSLYSKNYFPFVIRQKPGENNSLGRVKFMFPNSYSVYFHDTPSKSLFEKDIRAFSHGCVRINNPIALANFLLADQGMTPTQISEILESGKNTVIGLKNRIPVIITYWTCFIDENNQVFFFKDIYGRDKLILKALNE